MPQQTPANNRPQNPTTTPQLPSLGGILDKAVKAADTAVGVLEKANIPETTASLIRGAKTITNAKATIQELDKAVRDLEKAAPGTTKLVKETADAFAEIAKTMDLANKLPLPANIKPIATRGKETTEAFAKFTADYEKYTNAGILGKFKAAADTQRSWKDFQTKFDDFNKAVDNSGVVKDVADAANKAFDKIKGLIK